MRNYKFMRTKWMGACLGSLCLIVGAAHGQEKTTAAQQLAIYDINREVNLVGTVSSFSSSATAPLGPHVALQTAAGLVDVHLGDVRPLSANHFTVKNGDTLRIIGEAVVVNGHTQFVARVVQNRTQALMVRSEQGIPLSYAAPRNSNSTQKQGGVH